MPRRLSEWQWKGGGKSDEQQELRREAGGLRHYLEGKAVHCGMYLEVWLGADDGSDDADSVGAWIPVRYEATPRATLSGDGWLEVNQDAPKAAPGCPLRIPPVPR